MARTLQIILYWLAYSGLSLSAVGQSITVAADGSGNYTTIQAAINSLDSVASQPRVIRIKNGVYPEKLSIEKNNIILEGEDIDNTIISASIARDEWRCDHRDDWGVATVNIRANDLVLKNLTITNTFGFDLKEPSIIIACAGDTSARKEKKISKEGHQMALRTMFCTRLSAINCHFSSWGGDTVSPWDVDNGMWYFKDCVMEGGVDFYCPRGWAWAENCDFIAHNGPACIWHDGSAQQDAKTVLVNCRFKGYHGFLLGRYHRDAQFYLINCSFAANMKDSAIYQVPVAGNTLRWGKRIYYWNCHREGGEDYSWYQDNLPAGLSSKDITVNWVFKNKWFPVTE